MIFYKRRSLKNVLHLRCYGSNFTWRRILAVYGMACSIDKLCVVLWIKFDLWQDPFSPWTSMHFLAVCTCSPNWKYLVLTHTKKQLENICISLSLFIYLSIDRLLSINFSHKNLKRILLALSSQPLLVIILYPHRASHSFNPKQLAVDSIKQGPIPPGAM